MSKDDEFRSLSEGEELIYQTGLHKWVLTWPVLLILLSVVFIIVAAASGPNGFGSMFFWVLVFWIAVFLAITARLDYSTAHLYLTSRRIILKAGWMRKVLMEVLLEKVQGIDIDQSLMGRMLNYGVVTIKGIGINNITMKNVREPFEFREIAQKQIQKVVTKE